MTEPSGSDAGDPSQPDARQSLANERTLLAWMRTALAIIAAGLAATQFLSPFDFPGGRRLVGLPLILAGGLVALLSHRSWRQRERAIQAGEALPASPLVWMLTVAVVAIAVIAAVIAAQGTAPG